MYAEINNNKIEKILNYVKWRKESGEQFTDDDYAEHNIYKIVDSNPEYNPLTQYIEKKDIKDWNVKEKTVEITYNIIDYSIEQLKTKAKSIIEQKREHAENHGYIFELSTGETIKLETSHQSLLKTISAYILCKEGLRVNNSYFKTKDDIKQISNDDFILMAKKYFQFIDDLFEKEATAIELLKTSNTKTKIKNVVNNFIDSLPKEV